MDCSPFHRNLFLSSGCDTQIRIYNMLKVSLCEEISNATQQRPLNVLVPGSSYIFCSSWSPYRPMVFAAGCGDGKVFFFDMMVKVRNSFWFSFRKTKQNQLQF